MEGRKERERGRYASSEKKRGGEDLGVRESSKERKGE